MVLWVETQMYDRQPPATEHRAGFDRFGFLPFDTSCEFQGGTIEPVANYLEVSTWVRQHLYYPNLVARPGERFEPGILFPPVAWRERHHAMTDAPVGTLVGSYEPAALHRVPTSHYIPLQGVVDPETQRERSTGFLTKLFGFIQDTDTILELVV